MKVDRQNAPIWKNIASAPQPPLSQLFESDRDRVSRLTIEEAGLLFDFSKTNLDQNLLGLFGQLVEAQKFAAMRDRLFMGVGVNASENRAAEHGAERGTGRKSVVEGKRGSR